MANMVSDCCGGSVIYATWHEKYPLGIKEFNGVGILYRFWMCEACRRECEPVEACEVCGTILQDGECPECHECHEYPDQQRILNAEHEQEVESLWR